MDYKRKTIHVHVAEQNGWKAEIWPFCDLYHVRYTSLGDGRTHIEPKQWSFRKLRDAKRAVKEFLSAKSRDDDEATTGAARGRRPRRDRRRTDTTRRIHRRVTA